MKIKFILGTLLTFISFAKGQTTGLDWKKAPNSYIFEPANTNSGLLIPVKKAYSMWQSGAYMGGSLIPDGTITAEVYWEDVHGLIKSNPDYTLEIIGTKEDAKIKVPVNKTKEGNAVVVYKVDGQIYWSWHIWVTDDPSNGSTYMAYDNTKRERKNGTIENIPAEEWQWMDRNLGAISDAITEEGWNRNNGLLYQWGRKDPIPPLVSKGMDFYEVSGSVGRVRHRMAMNTANSQKIENLISYVPLSTAKIVNNIRLSVRNPLSLIYVNNDNSNTQAYYLNKLQLPVNWFGTTATSNGAIAEVNLWSDNSKGLIQNSNYNWNSNAVKRPYRDKSSYDPCPNGWRIPSMLVANIGNFNYIDDVRLDYSPFGPKTAETHDVFKNNKLNIIKPTNNNTPSYMAGLKIYPDVGVDATSVGGQNMGVFSGTGLLSRSTQGGQYTDMHEVYLWTATMMRWWDATPAVSARSLRIIPDAFQPDVPDSSLPNVTGRYQFRPLNENSTSDAMGCRCIKDPLYIVNEYDFPTEYFTDEIAYPRFREGIDNPNSYQIVKSSEETFIQIPINKAFAIQSEYLNNATILNAVNYNNLKTNVLWTTNTSLIKETAVSNPNPGNLNGINTTTINVKINPNQSGNAVITLHNGSITAPIYWSWHIWVTDNEINSIRYVTNEPNNAAYNYINYVQKDNVLDNEFMDRNLGALDVFPTVAIPTSPTTDELQSIKVSGGFHYQWGRKDPIPSFVNPDGSGYEIYLGTTATNGEITYTTLTNNVYNNISGNYIVPYNSYSSALTTDKVSEKVSKNLLYSVENPLVFMIPSTFSPNNPSNINYNNGTDWVIDDVNIASERWGHSDKKSPFDPCPDGWRIPDLAGVAITTNRDLGISAWSKKGLKSAIFYAIESSFKGDLVKNTSGQIIGFNFLDPTYSIGNYPFTGSRGFREVKENQSPTYDINQTSTGIWTSALTSNYLGRAIAFTMDRSTRYMAAYNDNIDPYAALNCRCIKTKITSDGLEDNGKPRMQIPPYTSAVVSKTLRTEEVKTISKEQLKVYPNPIRDILMINGKATENYYYQIYDMTGKIISSGKFIQNQINLSTLRPGIYFIRINDSTALTKIIKK
ncbi:T9SS type A sorting domain-containing protein [Empedobacter brevis]